MPILLLSLALLAAFPPVDATSWPGLWGPSRNGVVAAATPTGIDVLWRRASGSGYSEIAVHGGLAITMEARGANDIVVALDAATGRERWNVPVGPTYRGHSGSDDGPIATPTIAGGDVFALGPFGHLLAIDMSTAHVRWRHDLRADFGARAAAYGFAASPLVEGDLVIVPTWGASSKGLLAFDRESGRLVWSRSVAVEASYASAVAATIGGVRQVIAVAGDAVYAVNPSDGALLWRARGPRTGDAEVANSAIVLPGDRVLVSDWDTSVLIGVTRTNGTFATNELWRSTRLRSSNGPTVYRDGFLYGFVGPQLICVDAATGDVRWRERTGAGTLIALGDSLVVLIDGTGQLLVVRPSPARFETLHTANVLADGVRAVTGPSYADGRLYVRNLREIVALQLR